MSRLADVVPLLSGRRSCVIYARRPWGVDAEATLHDPTGFTAPPTEFEPFLDVDLAVEYLKAWSDWQSGTPDPDASVRALVQFVSTRTAD